MASREFVYEDRLFLNKLVARIREDRCDLSLMLRPNFPELIEVEEANHTTVHEGVRNIIESVARQRGTDFWEARKYCLLKLYQEFDVKPFTYLKYDRSTDHPLIDILIGGGDHSEFWNEAHHPMSLQRDFWAGVQFNEISDELSVQRTKEVANHLISKGYLVTELCADINLFAGTEAYQPGEYHARLQARRGKITLTGDTIPSDFDQKRFLGN